MNSLPFGNAKRWLLFFMTRLLFSLIIVINSIFTFGQTKNSKKIRYDGFYQTVMDVDSLNSDTTINYLRFYRNGKVISVGTEGTAQDLKNGLI